MTLSTGIESLDRQLSGGLDPGTLLAVVASPASQSEALLHTLIEERPTQYVTTVRRPESIRNDIAHATDEGDVDVDIEYVGGSSPMDSEFLKELTGKRTTSVGATTDETPIDRVYELLAEVKDGSNVIVNSTNPLERSGQVEYQLTVPKNRYGEPILEKISIMLESDIWIDDSRVI